MLENVDRIKERIQTLNNGFKSLNNFSETKQGELFGKIMQMQVKTASAPEEVKNSSDEILSEPATNQLKNELNQLINKFSKENNLKNETIKAAIASILEINNSKNTDKAQTNNKSQNLNLNDLLTLQYLNTNNQLANLSNLNSVSTMLNGINKN